MLETATLTAEQQAAVESPHEYTHIEACAGGGKTTVLAHRVRHLLEARPGSILAFAFTRSAATHLYRRIREVAPGASVDVTTFHAFAARTLPDGWRVASELQDNAALKSLYASGTRVRRAPGTQAMRRAATAWEARTAPPPAALDTWRGRLAELQLAPSWHLLPRLLKGQVPSYTHVLVDEWHNCTPNERAIADAVAAETLTTVGDPRQAIFGWRGAGYAHVTGHEPALYPLRRSFRFGAAIAAEANEVAERHGWDAIEPGDVMPSLVSRAELGSLRYYRTHPPTEQCAALCRTHRDCARVVDELGARGAHIKRDPAVALDAEADHIQAVLGAGKIPVMTVHGAQGREFDAVFLLPWDTRGEPEEDRLLYVAVTRARNRLVYLSE